MLQGSLRNLRRLVVAAGAGTALALSAAVPASAHAAMVSSDPEDGATLDSAPASVSATFSEILDGPSTEIAVTGPGNEAIDAGDVEFDGDTFTQPMLYTTPGEYTVAFRVISEDGHRVDGSISFTVEAIPDELLLASDVEGEDEETSDAAEPAEEPSAELSTEAADAAESEDSGSGVLIASVLVGALIVVVAGVVVFKLVKRRKES